MQRSSGPVAAKVAGQVDRPFWVVRDVQHGVHGFVQDLETTGQADVFKCVSNGFRVEPSQMVQYGQGTGRIVQLHPSG